MGELIVGLSEYFTFYNGERPPSRLVSRRRMPRIKARQAVGR